MKLVTPRLIDPFVPHAPHPPQQAFLWLNGLEAFYGGSAGGGKSDALLMAALQYVDVPGYSALILRKTWADLSLPGAIMDRCKEWLDDTPAKPLSGGRQWLFPSGARLTFGYIQYPRQRQRYRSAEFQFIGVDELTQFDERTYSFMFSRIRRPAVPCTRCKKPAELGVDDVWKHRYPVKCANCLSPLLKGDSKFKAERKTYRGKPVLHTGWRHVAPQNRCPDPRPKGIPCPDPALPDKRSLRQYPAGEDGLTIFDVPLRMRSASNPGDVGHQWVKARFVEPLTREPGAVFVPALLEDNPSLDEEAYVESLKHMASAVDLARMLSGDWDISEEGSFLDRTKFIMIRPDEVPAAVRPWRYWDLASTEDGGDWTAGSLLGQHEGSWYLTDMQRFQEGPAGVERRIKQTAMLDGTRVPIRVEQEGGASGKSVIDHFRRNVLNGFDVRGDRPSGSKAERARPMASAVDAGNFYVVIADWNREFLNEAEVFPIGPHDDQIDACSGNMHVQTVGKTRIIA